MDDSRKRVRDVARQQLDRRLAQIRESTPLLRAPGAGWVKTLREAYGMSQADLAERMEISRQSVSHLEKREADGSATLRALEEAARALGAELVYAIVPESSISDTLEERALALASRMTGSVRHTMRLEDQEPHSDIDQRTKDLAEKLLASPRQLWKGPDEG